jgi:Double sensory domain of two-component sensor kinase
MKKIKLVSLFLLLTFLSVFLFMIAGQHVKKSQIKLLKEVESDIAEFIEHDKDRLLGISQDIADGGELNELIKSEDVLGIIETLNAVRVEKNVDTFLVTNSNGIVLTRVPSVLKKGDDIFSLTDFGQVVANGEPVATIEAGRTKPLLIATGVPIFDEGEMIGAIFSGQQIHETYLKYLMQEYGTVSHEMIAFTAKESVIASTFDEERTSLLANHFNVGAPMEIFDKTLETNFEDYPGRYFRLLGENYYMDLSGLVGIRGTVGGFIIFQEHNTWLDDVLPQISVDIVLLVILYIIVRLGVCDSLKKKWQIVFFTLWIILFTMFFDLIIIEKYAYPAFNLEDPKQHIYNSTLSIEPEFDIIDTDTDGSLILKIHSGGEAINTVSAVVNYDPAVVVVLGIDKSRSICPQDTFIEEIIDNDNGRVEVSCIIPDTGFNGLVGEVVSLKIKPQVLGNITFEYSDESKVLAHDGLGTDVLRSMTSASYTAVRYSDYADENSYNTPIVVSSTHSNSADWYNDKNIRLMWKCLGCEEDEYYYNFGISSSSHSNSEKWYDNKDIEFSWSCVGCESDQFYYNFGQADHFDYSSAKEISGNTMEITVPEDGVYYLFMKSKENLPGAVGSFKVQIDSTPPEPLNVLVSDEEVVLHELVRIEFSGHDNLSGLESDYFYINMGSGTFLPVTSPVFMPMNRVGDNTIVFRAFDKAGNSRDFTSIIKVKANNAISNFIQINLQKFFQMWD